MTHKTVLSTVSAAVLATALAASCPPAWANSSGASTANQERPKIGYSIYDLKQPYFQAYLKGVRAGAQQYGFGKVLISNERSSERQMVSGSEELISQGISALIISPEDPAALPQVERAAKRAKIPVIIGDVGTAGTYWQAFVESNNAHGGAQAAQYLEHTLASDPKPHEIAIIALRPSTSVRKPRTDGFVDALRSNPDFKIVSTVNGKETVAGGYAAMAALLAAHPKLQGVYCENDPEAEGASRELLQAHKDPVNSPALVGFNGDPPALTLIKEKKMAADIAQNPYAEGVKAVEAARDLLDHKKPKFTDASKKTIEIPTQVVTAANVDKFIAGLKSGKLY